MKIKKDELIKTLGKLQKFTGRNKGYPILETVWFDGESQTITANNLKSHAVMPVNMTDCEKEIQVEAKDVSDQRFADELNGLKAGQLKDLSEYAGVPAGKKKDMVEGIFQASVDSANAGSFKSVVESFCVNPDHLLKIVKAQEEDEIELIPTDYDVPGDLFSEDVSPKGLSVGKHFDKLAIHQPEDFPPTWEADPTDMIGKISGRALKTATGPTVKESEHLYKENVYFDADEGAVVGCDGNRIHRFKADVEKNCTVPHSAVHAVAQVAGDNKITIMQDPNTGQVVMTVGDLKVTCNTDTDLQYPDYKRIFPDDCQKVTVDKKPLRKLLNDAGLVSDKDFKSVSMTFNDGLKAEIKNPVKGQFHKADIPISGSKIDPAVTVDLDLSYIKQALAACNSGDMVEVSITDAAGPVVIESGNFAGLIMPMRYNL